MLQLFSSLLLQLAVTQVTHQRDAGGARPGWALELGKVPLPSSFRESSFGLAKALASSTIRANSETKKEIPI